MKFEDIERQDKFKYFTYLIEEAVYACESPEELLLLSSMFLVQGRKTLVQAVNNKESIANDLVFNWIDQVIYGSAEDINDVSKN